MEDVQESRHFNFPAQEETILELWDKLDAFREQLRRSEGRPEYIFYDGPPFATGMPHYGHLLAGTIKVWHRTLLWGHPLMHSPSLDCSPRECPLHTPGNTLMTRIELMQDIVTRYATTTGHHVSRRFGWDCHGLPVEHEIDKKLSE